MALSLSSSLTILATFLLLLSSAAGTGHHKSSLTTTLSPFCALATDGVQCSNMAKGAGTWQEAMTNVITSAIERAKARQAVAYGIASKLPHNLRPQTKTSIETTCKEAYDTLIANLEKCLEYVKDDPTSSLKYYLTSLSLFDCQNALEEFELSVPEVTEFNNELVNMNTNFIAVLGKNSAYST